MTQKVNDSPYKSVQPYAPLVVHTGQVDHQDGAFPCFTSMKQEGLFLTPAWDASRSQGYPSTKFAGVPIYTVSPSSERIRSDEGLTLETSALYSLRWPIYIFNLVDITKLPCYPHRRSTTVSLETFTLYSIVEQVDLIWN